MSLVAWTKNAGTARAACGALLALLVAVGTAGFAAAQDRTPSSAANASMVEMRRNGTISPQEFLRQVRQTNGLDQIGSLDEVRQRLWELREGGQITQADYLRLARQMEPSVRSDVLQPLMDELGIKHTGNPPVQGGGIFSDIDGTAPTEEAYQQFLKRMKELDPKLKVYDRYSFRSDKYDVVGWRPRESVPGADGYAASVEKSMGQSLNNELAPTAIPGMGTPNALEANLEDLTKGARQMFEKVKGGYQGEADMVAAGKDVLRSMRAAGMCETNVLTCRWLSDLRSRVRSPKELGFSSNEQLQARLRELAAQAYRASESQFDDGYADLIQKLSKAGTGTERDRLVKLADEMAERATRMAARYETLQNLYKKYPEEMRQITGAKSTSDVWAEQTERVRKLREGQQAARDNVIGARSLNILLNVVEFARCMQEETTGTSAARRAKAQECILHAVMTYGINQGIEWGAGKISNVMITLPNGTVIASVLPAVMMGVVTVQAGLQCIDAGFEYWQKNQAELEQTQREHGLEQQQIRNMAEFPRRLAAEEKMVADSLQAIVEQKATLLDELKRLGVEQATLILKLHLRERRARLDQLLPGIKAEAEACWSAFGEEGGGASDPAAEARGLMAQAQRFVDSCHDHQDVARGDAAFQAATQSMDSLRRASSRPTGSAPRSTAVQDKAKALDEAQRLFSGLEAAAAAARGNIRELEQIRGRVDELNQSIETKKQSLIGGMERLEQAVPPSLVQALHENAPRVTALLQQIDGIETLPDSAWNPRWSAIVQNDAPLRALLEYMEDPGAGIAKALADAEDCRERRGGSVLGRAEEEFADASVSFQAQRAVCIARLGAVDGDARLTERLAQEKAALQSRLNGAQAAHDGFAARYELALQTAQGLVAQREAAARTAGGGVTAALTAELSAAPELCTQAESARQKLTDTLQSMDGYEKGIEASLTEAQQLAASCKDRSVVDRAEDRLGQAAGLQTSVDQRAAALAFLAVQVEDLATRRTALLKRRDEAAALVRGAPAAATLPPVDFSGLEAALAEMRAHGEPWGLQEVERHKQRMAQLQAEFAHVPAATLAAGTAGLNPLIDGIVATAWKDADLVQRAAVLAALRQRAEAAGRPAPADTRTLQAAVQAAACLNSALPNITTGIEQANTLRNIAQLATQKLGGAARDRLTTCTDRLAHDLSNADKQDRVAAKVCGYRGSEAYWDESEYRPMCRCTSGSKWNTERTACVTDKEGQVAQANCSRYPNTVPRWSDEKNAAVCSCKSGYRVNAQGQACEPDPAAAVAALNCPGEHARAYWNSASQQAACGCSQGYTVDPTGGCMTDPRAAVAAKVCPGEHTRAYWDNVFGEAGCGCAQGYREDPTGACEVDRAALVAQTDCSRLPNTAPYWDQGQGRPLCSCLRGYRLNARGSACETDPGALVASTDCSRFPHAVAYWDSKNKRAGCHCSDGFNLNPQSRTCEAPPASPLAGWVGHWTCQFKAQAQAHAETIRKTFPEQLEFTFAEDGQGGLKGTDGAGPMGSVPLLDNTHFSLPAPVQGATPFTFELRGDQIVGQTRMSIEGTMAYVMLACHH